MQSPRGNPQWHAEELGKRVESFWQVELCLWVGRMLLGFAHPASPLPRSCQSLDIPSIRFQECAVPTEAASLP